MLFYEIPESFVFVILCRTGYHLQQVFDTLLLEVWLCTGVKDVATLRVTRSLYSSTESNMTIENVHLVSRDFGLLDQMYRSGK